MITVRVVISADRVGEYSSHQVANWVATSFKKSGVSIAAQGLAATVDDVDRVLADQVDVVCEPVWVTPHLRYTVFAHQRTAVVTWRSSSRGSPHEAFELGQLVRRLWADSGVDDVVMAVEVPPLSQSGADFTAGLGIDQIPASDSPVSSSAGLSHSSHGGGFDQPEEGTPDQAAESRPAAVDLKELSLTLVAPESDAQLWLTGLRGVGSMHRESLGADLHTLQEFDDSLQQWAERLGVASICQVPGAGAAAGIGATVLALGGTVATPVGMTTSLMGTDELLAEADLAVAVTADVDFATRGGPVVAMLARQAEAARVPLIVVTGENYLSGRESRTLGIEAIYPVRDHPAALVGYVHPHRWSRELVDQVALTWL